ncbi:FAD-dependent monooxygenase [Microbacterium sp.]|uniref:FAD-dependent monooxygenase n=1 Tax=Microbacterium sp. TaxID=51671 RepID=UPI0039E63521
MTENTETRTSPAAGVLIVGGSLGGLTTALALAKDGVSSTVLERTNGRTQRGVAIRVAGGDLSRTLGPDARAIVAEALGAESMAQGWLPHAWWNVYSALRAAAEAEPSITLVDGAHVVEVGQTDAAAWARGEQGRTWEAPLLVGADGYRSATRRHVDEHRPDADYAGYVVWLGQSDIPERWIGRVGGPDFMGGRGDEMLAVYPLIEADGSVHRFGWGIFDPTRSALLRRIGAVDGTVVRHTPRSADIPDGTYEALARTAESRWPEPWSTPIAAALRAHEAIATPITEYLPDRVVDGRVALVGDAAHAQTPMTGAGFDEAVDDAHAIAEAVRRLGVEPAAFEAYELSRLADMRRGVSGGQSFSRSFAA